MQCYAKYIVPSGEITGTGCCHEDDLDVQPITGPTERIAVCDDTINPREHMRDVANNIWARRPVMGLIAAGTQVSNIPVGALVSWRGVEDGSAAASEPVFDFEGKPPGSYDVTVKLWPYQDEVLGVVRQPTLAEYQAAANAEIDLAAERIRSIVTTTTKGQSAIYLAKAADAKIYLADHASNEVEVDEQYPWVWRESIYRGIPMLETANLIVSTEQAWVALGADLEGQRVAIKAAINACKSASCVDVNLAAALDVINNFLETYNV